MWLRLFASLSLACQLSAQSNRLAPEERALGWELLFDGRTFNGWQDPTAKNPPSDSWVIENGTIKAPAHPKIDEHLLSSKEYGDFEMQWEWKTAPGGNSGVKYRIQDVVFIEMEKWKGAYKRFEEIPEYELIHKKSKRAAPGQDYVIGHEYQMTDDGANKDAKRGAPYMAGALYGAAGPASSKAKPAGEWNQSRLMVHGKHVTHWLNGEKTVDIDLDAPEVRAGVEKRWKDQPRIRELLLNLPKKKTPVALQNHGDADVWFRNLKIRPLD